MTAARASVIMTRWRKPPGCSWAPGPCRMWRGSPRRCWCTRRWSSFWAWPMAPARPAAPARLAARAWPMARAWPAGCLPAVTARARPPRPRPRPFRAPSCRAGPPGTASRDGWPAAAAAQAYGCDARITTIITGHLDPEIVAAAVRAYLGREDPDSAGDPADAEDSAASRDRLGATLIRYGTAMLAGPAGLASALRAWPPRPPRRRHQPAPGHHQPHRDHPGPPAKSSHHPGPALRVPRLPPETRPVPSPPPHPALQGRAYGADIIWSCCAASTICT